MSELFKSIECLNKIGKKRLEKYNKLGIYTPYDLLCYYPRYYIDYSNPVPIYSCQVGHKYAVKGTITEKNVGDATDRTGAVVLNLFRQQRSNGVVANAEKRQESIRLEPRITETIDSLEVSFKIGSSKLYVVKNLVELISAVENCDTLLYGKDTYINHQIDNFTQDSREWLKFITKAVDEEQLIDKRINGSRWGYDPMELKCSELKLYGWRMDSFYELIDDSGCEYNYWEKNGKKKKIIHTRQKNPRIKMLIDKNKDKDSNGFEGITVSCNLPHFYKGDETSYYIDGD